MKLKSACKVWCSLPLAVLVSNTALAGLSDWHLNGFLSQSLVSSSDNAFFGDTDDRLSLDFRELGIIMNGAVLSNVDFSMQVLSRSAGSADNGDPKVDYAFLTWRIFENAKWGNKVLLGQIKLPDGLYNDTRESPFTRSGIFLPQSLYFDRLRNMSFKANAVMYELEHRQDLYSLLFKAGYGKMKVDDQEIEEYYGFGDENNPDFSNPYLMNVSLGLDYDSGRVRALYYYSKQPLDTSFDILGVHIEGKTGNIRKCFSLEYNQENWSVTTELRRAYFEPEYNLGGDQPSILPEGVYIQGLLRPTEKWDIFVRYDRMVFDRHDRNGKAYAARIQPNMLPAQDFDAYANDATLGAAYRPTQAWLFRAEWHNVEGTMWATLDDMSDRALRKRYWNMAALSASWRF